MKIITPSYKILTPDSYFFEYEKLIEQAGRVCYKSEDKITETSAAAFCKKIENLGHHSVLEHSLATVKFICDRGVSHELVRHRLASYSQESTRYCNYSKDKFDKHITFIEPSFLHRATPSFIEWEVAMQGAEMSYFTLLKEGLTPQEARCILPNSLKTEIVVAANFREWIHIFTMRCSKKAHPQMRELMVPLCHDFATLLPSIFASIAQRIER